MRLAEAAREAARLQLEAELRTAADAEKARIAAELEAEKLRLAALEAEREAAKEAADAARKLAEEEAEERERLRILKNTKLQEQRDASRLAAEAAEAAKKVAEDELARLKALLEATAAGKAAAEAAAAAAEAARLAAEADAEEARRRREHQWALNAEHEDRLRKEQEAAIAARPVSAKKEDLGDLKRLPQKKKQSPAELAALARAQAAIEAAAAKRNAPKKILGQEQQEWRRARRASWLWGHRHPTTGCLGADARLDCCCCLLLFALSLPPPPAPRSLPLPPHGAGFGSSTLKDEGAAVVAVKK